MVRIMNLVELQCYFKQQHTVSKLDPTHKKLYHGSIRSVILAKASFGSMLHRTTPVHSDSSALPNRSSLPALLASTLSAVKGALLLFFEHQPDPSSLSHHKTIHVSTGIILANRTRQLSGAWGKTSYSRSKHLPAISCRVRSESGAATNTLHSKHVRHQRTVDENPSRARAQSSSYLPTALPDLLLPWLVSPTTHNLCQRCNEERRQPSVKHTSSFSRFLAATFVSNCG
jgi:hypothetical protein